jgi:RNA polymerase sigma-70 factor, ECF subfamily
VLLENQDRSKWDADQIREGAALVLSALRGGGAGRFAVQAAIAAVHADASTYDDTDWPQILALYDELLRIWPSPVVALNRCVAVLMVSGPAAALAEVDELDASGRLAGYRYLPATRADLLRRLGRVDDAAAAYRAAITLADNDAERTFLEGRLAETLSMGPGDHLADVPSQRRSSTT